MPLSCSSGRASRAASSAFRPSVAIALVVIAAIAPVLAGAVDASASSEAGEAATDGSSTGNSPWSTAAPEYMSDPSEEGDGLSVQVQLTLAVVLICLSAVFAGLTLGVMGLDTLTLEIIASAGSAPDCNYAKTILPVRKKGHQTLCTLVLGNMWANVMIAQFCADVNPEGGGSEEGGGGGSGAIVSFLLSTIIILIFTEVLPMSICRSKHALQIAAKGIPVLRVFMVLLFPIAWPLGKLLDKLIHHDPGQVYDRQEMKRLMMVHAQAEHAGVSGLQGTDLELIMGALEFREATVESTMTPLREVFMLEKNVVVDQAVLELLWKSGHSRVPVFAQESCGSCNGGTPDGMESPLTSIPGMRMVVTRSGSPNSPHSPTRTAVSNDVEMQPLASQKDESNSSGDDTRTPNVHILGLLFVKDLILLDPSRRPNAAELLETYPHGPVHYLDASDHLDHALRLFQSNAAHMAVVRDGHTVVGIVTLEDLVERMIQSEIYDEYDDEEEESAPPHVRVDGDGPRPANLSFSRLAAQGASRIGFHSFAVEDLIAAADPVTQHINLRPEQAAAIASYLVTSVEAFAAVSAAEVVRLVSAGAVLARCPAAGGMEESSAVGGGDEQNHRDGAPLAPVELHSEGHPVEAFVLVVAGGLTVTAGVERFSSPLRSWGWLGAECLLQERTSFVPRYTATVTRDSLLVLVPPASFHGLRKNRDPPLQVSPTAPGGRSGGGAHSLLSVRPIAVGGVGAATSMMEESARHPDVLGVLGTPTASVGM